MNLHIAQEILGGWLILSGVIDGVKYRLQTNKVRQSMTAKNCSRLFMNLAILGDLGRVMYGVSIMDWFIVITSLIALYFMCEYWWTIYTYYPYKHYPMERRIMVQRPSLLVYLINSFTPNSKRKHL